MAVVAVAVVARPHIFLASAARVRHPLLALASWPGRQLGEYLCDQRRFEVSPHLVCQRLSRGRSSHGSFERRRRRFGLGCSRFSASLHGRCSRSLGHRLLVLKLRGHASKEFVQKKKSERETDETFYYAHTAVRPEPTCAVEEFLHRRSHFVSSLEFVLRDAALSLDFRHGGHRWRCVDCGLRFLSLSEGLRLSGGFGLCFLREGLRLIRGFGLCLEIGFLAGSLAGLRLSIGFLPCLNMGLAPRLRLSVGFGFCLKVCLVAVLCLTSRAHVRLRVLRFFRLRRQLLSFQLSLGLGLCLCLRLGLCLSLQVGGPLSVSALHFGLVLFLRLDKRIREQPVKARKTCASISHICWFNKSVQQVKLKKSVIIYFPHLNGLGHGPEFSL